MRLRLQFGQSDGQQEMIKEQKTSTDRPSRQRLTSSLSVGIKFIILFVLIQIVIGSPFFITTVLMMRRSLTLQAQRSLRARCVRIATSAKEDFLKNDFSRLLATLDSFAPAENRKETIYIGVYDGPGSLMFSQSLSSSPAKTFAQIKRDQNAILVSEPVAYKGQHLGRIDIYSTKNQAVEDLFEMEKIMMFLAILSILITTPWTMFWAYYWLINPVSKLADAAEEVSEGNLDIELDIQSSDEVGELAETFTAMAKSLKDRGKELQEGHEKLRANYKELEIAHQKLKQLDEMKSEFMAITSHELLTPISTIRAYAETLLSERFGPLQKEQAKTIKIIENVTVRLSRIVDDFVDYTLLEKGKLKFEKEKVALQDVLKQTADELKLIIEEHQLKLALTVPDDLPPITGDTYRLHQVFDNILANAIRFTPDGGNISIDAKSKDGTISISFSDTGIGVAKQKISQIFLPFQQVEKSTKRKFKGAGLGLAISKKIVEAHGGKIEVDSKLGKGSTFTCLFPIK